MSTINDLVTALGPGWKLVGNGTPIEDTAVTTVTDPLGVNPPKTVNRGSGKYYVTVQDPDGHERALFLSPGPIKGGLVVRQTGVNDKTDASGNVLDDNGTPTGEKLYDGDLRNIQWNQAGPVADVPQTPKQPSPSNKLDKLDANGNVIPPGDTTTKPVTLRDAATGTTIQVPAGKDPIVTAFGDNLVKVDPDGTVTTLQTKPKDKQQLNVPGVGLVEYDPSKTGSDAYNVIIKTPSGLQAKDLQPQVRNGNTYIPVDDGKGGITWQQSDLPAQHTYTVAAGGNDPNSQYITLIDENGNSTAVEKKGWTPPKNAQAGTAVTPDTTSPFVVTIDDKGQPVFTKNQNQLTISDAQKQLIQQLGGKVADGSMSEKAAQDLITNLTQAMTAQASQQNAQANMLTAQTGQQRLGVDTANDVLTNVNQAAQTGAGLLQNRVTAGAGALNQAISAIGNSKMTSAPAGMGANLTGGLQEWVTQLGGGQPVYDSAAAMVNAANPSVKGDPTVATQAYTALRGAMDLYKQQTGQDWQPRQSFTSPTTSGGGTSTGLGASGLADGTPMTNAQLPNPAATAANQANNLGFNPQASTAAMNARGLLDNPQGRAIAAGQTPVATGAPTPTTPGLYNPAYVQAYPSAVGRPATGPVVGLQPLPIPPLPFQAPVTA
jgi:hypothetical protein